MKEWEKELHIFHCSTLPYEKRTLHEYIELHLKKNISEKFVQRPYGEPMRSSITVNR